MGLTQNNTLQPGVDVWEGQRLDVICGYRPATLPSRHIGSIRLRYHFSTCIPDRPKSAHGGFIFDLVHFSPLGLRFHKQTRTRFLCSTCFFTLRAAHIWIILLITPIYGIGTTESCIRQSILRSQRHQCGVQKIILHPIPLECFWFGFHHQAPAPFPAPDAEDSTRRNTPQSHFPPTVACEP
ncbi:hypothetical protein HDK90DRAFT_312530 [Phyllosticta capitalensis]|uniref:Uncharacterized protein n=1 Tax=Phyllosticta capitalensis TaxID=121624 RepID=A0ABR1YLP9_9PEZI